MRVPLAAAAILLSALPAPAPVNAEDSSPAAAAAKPDCRKAKDYKADGDLAWRDEPLVPRKLGELPPATAYMAVYRTSDGCEVPLTVADYRRMEISGPREKPR